MTRGGRRYSAGGSARPTVPGSPPAAEDSAPEVRAVAVQHGAEVEQHGVAGAERGAPGGGPRLQPLRLPAREDVRGERGRERAAHAHLVLDLLDELVHR